MKREIAGEQTIWIDLENPTEKELRALTERHKIHPLVINELRRPTFRPKVENYGDFLYMILHFPVYNAKDSNYGHEVDFVIGKDFLITAHYQTIPALKQFSKNKKEISGSNGNLLYDLLSGLFSSSLAGLEIIDKNISHMEEAIFHEPGREFIERISVLRREILDFRRAIQPQESVLVSLADHGKKFFGKDMAPYLNKIIGDYLRVWHILENHKEMIEALHQTNESLISVRTTEITKNLTLMAFITLPLTVLASIFGMNFENAPIIGHPFDFWIIMGIMLLAVAAIVAFFRHKKWI